MQCMRCGKEIRENSVFCPDCLQVMAQNPVKPGTPVQLLQRPQQSQEKVIHTKEVSAEESARKLRGLVRWLTGVIVLLSVLLCITAVFLLHSLQQQQPEGNLGRNYTTDTSDRP